MKRQTSGGALLTVPLMVLAGLFFGACSGDDGTTAANGDKADIGEAFWQVDAAGNSDSNVADTSAASDAADIADAVTGVDQACYKACMDAGKGDAVCTKGCPDKAGGGKTGGTCYDGCIAKAPGEQAYCKDSCTCYDGCLAKGKSANDCLGCFGDKSAPKYDQVCYDACLKKGGDKATCAKDCPAKSDGKGTSGEACYNECIKTEKPETCKTKCYSK